MDQEQKVKPKAKVYIDGSNVFYTQKKLGWSLDWVKIKDYLGKILEVLEYRYYTGIKQNDEKMPKFLKYLDAIGFNPITKPLKKIRVSSEENAYLVSKSGFIYKANFDVEITADVLLNKAGLDEIVLFSGDSDFEYLVKKLKDRGQKTRIIASKSTVSWKLKLAAAEMVFLENLKANIIRQK